MAEGTPALSNALSNITFLNFVGFVVPFNDWLFQSMFQESFTFPLTLVPKKSKCEAQEEL
eukprot:10422790-Karenia_brevis.AAC.1